MDISQLGHFLSSQPLTLQVIGTRLGWEGGVALETGFRESQKQAQKTRGVPQVGCTHCWVRLN
jgi:hypothetical protein